MAPVPQVLHVADDWLAVAHLPGRPLTELSGTEPVRQQAGAAVARIHAKTGTRFGYTGTGSRFGYTGTGSRASGTTWPEAFTAMVDDLLADARDWKVALPSGIAATVVRHRAVLAHATRPALLHFDLWDGNVLAEAGQLTGLVDGERYLFGDPLLDLVSPALFQRIEEEPGHPFLRGYTGTTALVLDGSARTRLALYRVHLYTLMLTEAPSRGIPVDGDRSRHVAHLLSDELHLLGHDA
ncbi:phosphotransferase family protein [Actinoplanes sp. TFC3]|uniref:phosphotransferase family protein n=1 Tax=Actinoplanes sp. TFC3 TaxID=1710355 RepID=UPI001F335167|nr:phosphotransferase [Actinoplanes sp. TFC3]